MNKATVFVIILVIIAVGAVVYTRLGVSGDARHPQDEQVMQQSEETSDSVAMDKESEEVMDGAMHDGMATSGSGDVMTHDAMGSSDAGASVNVSATDAAVKSFTVTGQNFSFSPSQITVKKGDTVKITFKNSGGFHDFVIDEFKVATKQIASGAEETVEFVADKVGNFEFYCSVGSHRAMGMKGTLVVQ